MNRFSVAPASRRLVGAVAQVCDRRTAVAAGLPRQTAVAAICDRRNSIGERSSPLQSPVRTPALQKAALLCAFLLSTLNFQPSTAFAQVSTGAPPFGSFSGGPDTVNNANLNVHLSVPVLVKAGRGTRFSYVLSFDSSVWFPVTSGTTQVWTPASNWGWRGVTEAATGYVTYTTTQIKCFDSFGGWFWATKYSGWAYHDPSGTGHSFGGVVVDSCSIASATGTANDGSGYKIAADDGPGATVYSASGTTISPPVVPAGTAPTGGGTVTDSNGNQLSTTGTTFTDTLGTTALSISGSGTPTSPVTYAYTNPGGTSSSVTVNYTAQTVKTNFGCAGISEYGPTTQNLIASISLADGTSYSISYEATPGFAGDVTGRIAKITLPTGGTVTYAYSGGSGGITCADGSTATLTRTLSPGGTWTYAHTESGTAWTTTQTDPAGNQTVMQFQGIFETERQVKQGTATVLATVDTCYNGAAIPCTGTAITLPISNRTVQTTLGAQIAKTYTTFNTFGLPTEVDEYDWGGTSLVRKTVISYATTLGNIVDRPSSITVYKSDGVTQAAQTTFAYDVSAVTATTGTPQHVAVTGSRGNLTSIVSTTQGTSTLTRSFTYYDTGTVNTATDVNGAVTTFSYSTGSCGNSFPTSVTLPLALTGSTAWNCNGGVPTSATDANGKTTSLSYDNLWRPTTTSFADGGSTSVTYSATARDISTALTSTTSRQDHVGLDGLGRAIQQALVSDPAGQTNVDTSYDSVGRVLSASNPYRGTASGGDTLAYDALSRLTSVTHADATAATSSYSGNCSTATDEAGKQRKTCSDALGRITDVYEPDSTGALAQLTHYVYDALDNLTSVTQGTQTRTYAYDMLSRLTSATTPESGLTTYTYNTSSDLATRTDARNIVTTYTYDALHRLTGKTYSNGDAAVNYFYDQATYNGLTIANGKGRRTGMSDASGATAWTYDAMGRALTERRTIGTVTKTMSYSYYLDGALASVTYPSGRVVSYDMTAAGRPTYAKDTLNGINYALNATYAPQGALSSILNGQSGTFGGVTLSATYNNRLLPATLVASSTAGTALNLAFSYFANGNVSTITNNRDTTRTQSFTYDNLNRIASGQSSATTGTNCWGQSFGYDRYANLLSTTVTKCTAPMLSLSVNATTNRVTNAGFTYDGAGNMLGDGVNTYTWDAENHVKTVASVTYTYDGDGQRVKKSNGTLYWFGGSISPLAETDLTGNITNEYIFFSGARIARRDSAGNVYYYFPDHLGSSRTITTSTGTLCYDADFYPFGGEQVMINTCAQNYKFTGLERDSETGNDHTLFRQYASNLGRWLSPDPLGGGVLNPQSWNRYAYVLNRPTVLTDKLGLCPAVSIPGHCAEIPVRYDVGPLGGFGINACGVDPFCIQAGGIGPFGSPVAQIHCDDNGCTVGSYVFSQYHAGGTYTVDWAAQRAAEIRAAVKIFLEQEAAVAAALGIKVEDLRTLYLNADGSLKDPNGKGNPFLQGGNWNFLVSTAFGCGSERCGSIPSLHFVGDSQLQGIQFVHLDTANPSWGYGLGAAIHVLVDVFLGNTVLASGIPR